MHYPKTRTPTTIFLGNSEYSPMRGGAQNSLWAYTDQYQQLKLTRRLATPAAWNDAYCIKDSPTPPPIVAAGMSFGLHRLQVNGFNLESI